MDQYEFCTGFTQVAGADALVPLPPGAFTINNNLASARLIIQTVLTNIVTNEQMPVAVDLTWTK